MCTGVAEGNILIKNLDGVIGVCNEGDEEAEDHVDEEWNEGVEVDPAENPHEHAFLLHVLEGGEHVVSINEWEQTLWHRIQGPELKQKKTQS